MNKKKISCNNCLHDEICYMQEICGREINEQLDEFGCKDFKDRTKWVEKKYAPIVKLEQSQKIYADSRCMNCQSMLLSTDTYCPNCGAIMRK